MNCKRNISMWLLFGMLSLTGLIMPVSAQTEQVQAETLSTDQTDEQCTGSTGYAQGSVQAAIYNALKNVQTAIPISQYNMKASDIANVYAQVIKDNPDLFYVQNYVRYTVNSSEIAQVLHPNYKYTQDEIKQKQEAFYKETDKILKQVKSSWTDLEKVLYVHDYVCTHYEYDMAQTKYSALDLFVDHTGVCQAYSEAMKYLLNELKIPSRYATSHSMNHMWNVVQIDGSWYHLDATWDDPVADRIGRVRHTNFLKSDTAMEEEEGHSDWSAAVSCTDTRYDDAFWNNVNAAIVYQDGQWYCISNSALYQCDVNQCKLGTQLDTLGDWSAGDGYTYLGSCSGLGGMDGILYFNTYNKIYAYTLKTKEVSVLKEADMTKGNIYGCYLDEGCLYYGQAEDISATGKIGVTDSIAIAHTHRFQTAVVAPTCARQGYTLHTCEICGYEQKDNYTEKTAHQYNDGVVVKEPDCTQEGEKVYSCQVCGYERTESVPAKGHVIETRPGKDATCTTAGWTQGEYCSVCGAVVQAVQEIPALGHSYDEGQITQQPTCETSGILLRTCQRCHNQTGESIPKTGHTYVWNELRQPSATSEGIKQYICTKCGNVDQQIIEPKLSSDTSDSEENQIEKMSEDIQTVSNKYKIQYVLNGGTNSKKNPTSYASGTTIKLQKPTKKGYTFKGWYTDAKFKTKITQVTNGNKKLYAKWEKVKTSATKISKTSSKKTGQITVSWKKTQADGYEILYATSQSMKNSKKVTVKTGTTATLKNLQKGKTYYIKVRPYKLDSTGKKVYGNSTSISKSVVKK